MITILCAPYGDGLCMRAYGHADFAPLGQDIICAGVSMLLQAFLDYLRLVQPIATEDASLEVKEGNGLLEIRTRGFGGRDLDAFSVAEAGLRRLSGRFPGHVHYMGRILDAPRFGDSRGN